MVKDLRSLAVTMPKIAKALDADINALIGEITISVTAAVAKETPVDVGTARSNWHVSDSDYDLRTRAAYSPFPSRWRPPYGAGGTLGETRNLAGVTWSAAAAVSKRKTDQSLYITNNIPYINRLNQGWSKQSPAGFIQRGISTGVNRAIKTFKFKNINRVI